MWSKPLIKHIRTTLNWKRTSSSGVSIREVLILFSWHECHNAYRPFYIEIFYGEEGGEAKVYQMGSIASRVWCWGKGLKRDQKSSGRHLCALEDEDMHKLGGRLKLMMCFKMIIYWPLRMIWSHGSQTLWTIYQATWSLRVWLSTK